MKKSFVTRLGVLALALTLVTTCLTGGTLAKYTSEVTGTGTADVAKWAVALKSDENATTASTAKTADFDFTLADTGTNKDNVAEKKIAPGSTGSVAIEIDASGTEVATKLSYTLNTAGLSATGLKDVPIKFYSDSSYSTEITSGTPVDKTIAAGATGNDAKVTQVIYWKWVTTDDATDTTIGSTVSSGTFTIKLSAEQVIAPVTP